MLSKWLPEIQVDLCTGCGKCVEACGPRSLTIANGIAVLSDADSCGSEEHCIEPCPEQAIRMTWFFPSVDNTNRGLWQQCGAPAVA